MRSHFPLTEQLWTEWIQDQLQTVPKNEILDLYSKANLDYLSIKLQRDHVLFAIRGYFTGFVVDEVEEDINQVELSTTDSWLTVDQVRDIVSSATNITSHHFTQSHLVWNLFRDFEMAVYKTKSRYKLLSFDQFAQDTYPSLDQIARIRSLYLARLKIAHADIETTFSAYSSFETLVDNANYMTRLPSANSLVAKTRLECEMRLGYEDALVYDIF